MEGLVLVVVADADAVVVDSVVVEVDVVDVVVGVVYKGCCGMLNLCRKFLGGLL